ncbi:multiple monosaccharide ABC transporter permease [Streptomyces sp. NPDC059837]|jgi:putative multiple sugar transport system permease protein|uniref:multiple monosaccharide ABC transporter permease n=1 Tax=unclassified Streptomyces TaxID=2593676 RepID=UPI002255DDDF|nr:MULTISPECIES: multiple monosaccharide ABC transporter permease [unclassified Streptomyces]MCX4400969.1 sugar ABC transporter permease [Streptomyces sp. NBC_01764]MCX4453849.1 sugar ABC transporter permease [Streptomyces sp. NBC_01719]MCX4493209.1 sugar ABC transporter permease [Streptomyces sp. NBC_01728]MCX4592239.1 sugar ABC transporter permease [Streptomyces sp. NBC_01549]MCX5184412.1 sugar ABC transporter permease [Streptomyces sp. NBC_00268]
MSTDVTAKTPAPAPPGKSGSATGEGLLQLMLDGMRRNMRQYGMLFALGLIVVLFAVWTDGDLLLPRNVSNLVLQNSYILILAIGMMLVIIAGHIDLSVGSLTAFVGAMGAVLMVNHDISWPIALVLCLAIGAAAGAAQGFFIAYLGMPSFIVTLAGMLTFRGLTEIFLKGQTIGPFPDGLQKVANGFLPEVGPNTNYHNLTLLLGIGLIVFVVFQEVRDRKRQQEFSLDVLPTNLFYLKLVALVAAVLTVTMLLASYKGAPVVLLILGVLVVGFGYLMRNSVIGRHVYAIGGNLPAAKLSGVKDKKVVFLLFLNMGMLAALAGLVFAARFNAASPKAGLNFELEAIAASFIGGASMSGGVGTVLGAIIGGLVLGVLNNGMNLVGIGSDWQQVIKGLVLLAAVGFDVWNKRKVGS